MFRWNGAGLAPLAARPSVDVGDEPPVAVRLTPALTGCPLRGGTDGVCKVYGGPWTSSSFTAANFWRCHRVLLIEAFGCDVCNGEGENGAIGAVDLFTRRATAAGSGQAHGPSINVSIALATSMSEIWPMGR